MLGEKSYGGTPRNIPNLEVKPVNAESTWREASWEDRNLPSFKLNNCQCLVKIAMGVHPETFRTWKLSP